MEYPGDYYTAQVNFGTPPQTLTVTIDSSWPDQFVLGENYTEPLEPGQKVYDSRLSSTSETTTFKAYTMTGYGDGTGVLVLDVIELLPGLSTDDQYFVALQLINYARPERYPVDGQIGLGWPTPWDPFIQRPTFVQRALANLDDQSYTVWLDSYHPPSAGPLNGVFTFGGFDDEHCDKSTLVTVKMHDTPSYWPWYFKIDSVVFGAYADPIPIDGTLSSGVPFLGAPRLPYYHILDQFDFKLDKKLNLFLIDCGAALTGPELTLTIAGKVHAVPASDYIVDLELANGKCALALSQHNPNQWELGQPFMQRYCTTFDTANNVVGFADKRD